MVRHNVLGALLEPCLCKSGEYFASHNKYMMCVKATYAFLDFCLEQGQDMETERQDWGFTRLEAGDCCCIHARQWLKAYWCNAMPLVILESTPIGVLDLIDLELLKLYSTKKKAVPVYPQAITSSNSRPPPKVLRIHTPAGIICAM